MAKRRTKKDKIIARLRRQALPPSSPPHTPIFTSVKRETPILPQTPPSRLDPPNFPQNSAISPHTTAVKASLLKTLILAACLAALELVIYWVWR